MRYKIVIGGITDGRHWEYYSCKSLFLDEGEVKVRMYGEDFLFKSVNYPSWLPRNYQIAKGLL